MKTFEIKDQFYLNGAPFKIISGSIHYFRVLPEYWQDRFEKLVALGCNTVETYVPWNLHEPRSGEFDFYGAHLYGMLDLVGFVRLAQEMGLWVILRPSPYICAEWEFGGLPAWLLKGDGIKLRTSDPRFLMYVKRYYQQLIPMLVPLQVDRGGPVLMMQVENEYGSYGNDKEYLRALASMMRELGVTVPLFSSDGPQDNLFLNTLIEDVFPTANFGSRTEKAFRVLRNYNNGGPCMCTEFWIGWFDAWKVEKHYGNLELAAENLEEILAEGSVNFYMFEGGTNFGFMNGANYADHLTADVTSYDYDAILTEDGQITEKYRRFQEVILTYLHEKGQVLMCHEECMGRDAMEYGKIPVKEKTGLFQNLKNISKAVETVTPLSMERHDQNYGYILYSSVLHTENELESIRLLGAADRAIVWLEDKKLFTAEDTELQKTHCFKVQNSKDKTLHILMENMGRVNYGPMLPIQRKGIDEGVVLNNLYFQCGWNTYPLPLDNLENLCFDAGYTEGFPAFYRFEFNVEEIIDTFLDYEGWGKGAAFINGFNLGRYWEVGPQKRLYLPGALLKKGNNELILFETEGKHADFITLTNEPMLG